MLTDGFMHIKHKRLTYALVILIIASLWINPSVRMSASDTINLYNKHFSSDTFVMKEMAKKFGIDYRIGDHLDEGAVVIYLKFPDKFKDAEKNKILVEIADKIAKETSSTSTCTSYGGIETDGEATFEMGVIMRKSTSNKFPIRKISLSPILYAAINNRKNFSVQGTSLDCKVFCYPFFRRSVISKSIYGHTLSFGFLDSNPQKDSFKSRYIIADFIPAEIYTFKLFGLHLSGHIRYHPGEIGISRLVNFGNLKQTGKR